MYIIPIGEATLDLIEVLNEGVRPLVDENEKLFFVYYGDAPSEIITDTLRKAREYGIYTTIKILYKH